MRFYFYRANADYCDFLRKSDPCVPYTMDKKSARPFVGVVLSINNYSYYAPITSPKPKHLTMKNQIDFLKINNGTWGAINLNNMIPIHTDSLQLVDMKISPTDDKATIDYKNLLYNQLSWCNKTENISFISEKAQNLYVAIREKSARPQLKKRCCNFPVDETQYLVYCKANNISIEKKTELTAKPPAPEQPAKLSMKDRFAAAQAEAEQRNNKTAAPYKQPKTKEER